MIVRLHELRPHGNRVLCRALPRESGIEGIVLPDGRDPRGTTFDVLYVGPKVLDVKPGDRILTGPFAGSELLDEPTGETLWQLPEEQILAVIGKADV